MTNGFWEKRKIFPSITTTRNSDWRAKMEEIKKFGVKKIGLFLTCLKKEQREEFYKLLEETGIKEAPLVHIRGDMKLRELVYLVKRYKTRVFNIHSEREYPLFYDYSEYEKNIYIENVYKYFYEEEIKKFGGICLDFSHLENDRLLSKEKFEYDVKIIERYKIGCNHISAVKKYVFSNDEGENRYDSHILENLSELDYLKRYPAEYFSSFIAIELENSIGEQLKARDYIINLLEDK